MFVPASVRLDKVISLRKPRLVVIDVMVLRIGDIIAAIRNVCDAVWLLCLVCILWFAA
jgi:hypothetical protein